MNHRLVLILPQALAILVAGAVFDDVTAQDNAGPQVTSVGITSRPQSGDTYVAGNVIRASIRFDKRINVTGNPQLVLQVGRHARQMTYTGCPGCDISYLLFKYTVLSSDYDDDGVGFATDALSYSGASVTDLQGNGASSDLGTHAFLNHPDHKVDGQQDPAPSVSDVRIIGTPSTPDTFSKNETIFLRVYFDEPVRVTGSPSVELQIGCDPARRPHPVSAGQPD